jgi:3-oxoadipate enol-lactonase
MSSTQDIVIGDTLVRISGEGFPLVFVHGFTTTSEFWKAQADEFSKQFRVVRINLPGHGGSPAPTSRSYKIPDFVEDVARVFKELRIDKAVLIGLSMGGIISQMFAVKYPQLLDGLVLADTTAHGVGEHGKADLFLSAVDEFGAQKAIEDLSDRSFSDSVNPKTLAWARHEVVQTPEFVARMAIRSISDADTRGSLSEIHAPTLVVVVEFDQITPPHESDVLAEGISHSQ